MLEVSALDVWCNGVGQEIRHATMSARPGAVTAVIGRSDAGGSALLRAIAGSLPPGSLTRGSIRLDGVTLSGAPASDLSGHVLTLADWALPPTTVGNLFPEATETLAELGLDPSQRISALPPDLRSRVHAATLATAPPARLVVADQLLPGAEPELRERIADQLASRAEAGAVVVWAEHDLDSLWRVAHRFVELVDGVPATWDRAWEASTMPEPTLLTASRLLGIDPALSRRPESLAAALTGRSIPSRPPGRVSTERGTLLAGIDGGAVGLLGGTIEVHSHESIGLVATERPEPYARALVKALGGKPLPSRLGDRRARLVDPSPLWLPHAQLGLDPRARHTLAAELARGQAGPRIITSRDVEFLVRACHRIVVIEAGRIVADGSPRAIVGRLPSRPLLARALGSNHYLRLQDLLSALEVIAP